MCCRLLGREQIVRSTSTNTSLSRRRILRREGRLRSIRRRKEANRYRRHNNSKNNSFSHYSNRYFFEFFYVDADLIFRVPTGCEESLSLRQPQ